MEYVMSRYRLPLLAAAAFAAIGATAAAAYDEGLVRIEPRPYYGAVVTVEQGWNRGELDRRRRLVTYVAHGGEHGLAQA